MYNLLVAFSNTAWSEGVYEFPRERVAIEYTDNAISERYKDLAPVVIDELKEIPSVFAVENEEVASRVGYISSIKTKGRQVRIEFTFDPSIQPLPPDFLADSPVLFELGRFELNRTHWAIKDGDLWSILQSKGISCSKVTTSPAALVTTQKNPEATPTKRVFVVHGHDGVIKREMAEALRNMGCEPIILHEQASGGLTIIEKMERYSDVGFAVVLYTPCDIGGKWAMELQLARRARQNVVFEHGYLMSKLGRNKVMAFVRDKVETPSDISGVVYIEMDTEDKWKEALAKELKALDAIRK